jgi:hypothetical protein
MYIVISGGPMLKNPRLLRIKKNKSSYLFLILSMLVWSVAPYVLNTSAQAAVLTEASIRLDRMGSAVAANTTNAKILVVFKPTTTATEGKIVITWPTTNAFTVSSTDADHTATTTGIPSTYQGETLNAVPSLGSPGAESSGVVTFTSGDLTPGTLYGFYVTGGITNPASGNAGTHAVTIATTTSGDVAIDSQTVAVDTLSSSTGDQVSVTATVPPSFNFAIADSTIALGTLSTGSVSTNAMSSGIDVDTNAANGYVAFIRSEGSANTLASASTNDAISSTNTGSPVVCAAGSECYVVDAAVSGTGTPTTEYDGNGTTSGGVIPTSPTYDEMVTATAPVNNDAITLTAIVAISALNEAATDYTDTWEVVGAGNF